MYGSDPLGLLSWRFKLDEGGYGVTSDLLSHSVDLAHMLLGPITRVVGTTATFITERPLALPGAGHYGRGAPGDPTGEVTNEDYAGMLCEFANGVRGTFESSRTIVGPESQMAFDVHGTQGRRGLEPREAQRAAALPAHRRPRHRATRPSSAATASPTTGISSRAARTASASRTWWSIEDYEFCRAIAEERPFSPGFTEAVEWVSVQAALLKSVQTGRWEPVVSLQGGVMAATTTKAVRIGVIGAGRIGRMHAELLARQVPGARLTAVQDADEETARSVAGRARRATAVPTVDDVLRATSTPSRSARRRRPTPT